MRSLPDSMGSLLKLFRLLAVVCALAAGATAQTSAASDSPGTGSTSDVHAARIAKLEQAVVDARSSGDNAWMLVCSALVLMMTGPGLALFYGGLVPKKNVLATMMQSFAMMAIITILWGLVSYSLAFGPGTSVIGGFGHLLLHGVGATPDADY